jgi:hypothetical protein
MGTKLMTENSDLEHLLKSPLILKQLDSGKVTHYTRKSIERLRVAHFP